MAEIPENRRARELRQSAQQGPAAVYNPATAVRGVVARRRERFGTGYRLAFASVVLVWLFMAALGSVPFYGSVPWWVFTVSGATLGMVYGGLSGSSYNEYPDYVLGSCVSLAVVGTVVGMIGFSRALSSAPLLECILQIPAWMLGFFLGAVMGSIIGALSLDTRDFFAMIGAFSALFAIFGAVVLGGAYQAYRWYKSHVGSYSVGVQPRPSQPQVKYVAYVKVRVANVRVGPGRKYRVLAKLRGGTPVRVISEHNGWARVLLSDNRQGYIYRRLIGR